MGEPRLFHDGAVGLVFITLVIALMRLQFPGAAADGSWLQRAITAPHTFSRLVQVDALLALLASAVLLGVRTHVPAVETPPDLVMVFAAVGATLHMFVVIAALSAPAFLSPSALDALLGVQLSGATLFLGVAVALELRCLVRQFTAPPPAARVRLGRLALFAGALLHCSIVPVALVAGAAPLPSSLPSGAVGVLIGAGAVFIAAVGMRVSVALGSGGATPPSGHLPRRPPAHLTVVIHPSSPQSGTPPLVPSPLSSSRLRTRSKPGTPCPSEMGSSGTGSGGGGAGGGSRVPRHFFALDANDEGTLGGANKGRNSGEFSSMAALLLLQQQSPKARVTP